MAFSPPILLRKEDFGTEEYEEICEFIEEKIEHLDRRLQTFRTQTLPEYLRLYKGRPKNDVVDWPWEGASNLQIPLIGTYTDELLARTMGGIWMYDPLWTAMLSGDTPSKDGEEMKEIYQQFLADMSYDPEELDLYRVEQAMFTSANKNGTGVIHFPWEYRQEIEMLYLGGGIDSTTDPEGTPSEFDVQDNPVPEMIPLNRWGFEPSVTTLRKHKFFYHIEPLTYWDIKNLRSRSPYYKQSDIDLLLENPDAVQEDEMEEELNYDKKIENSSISTGAARWYIHHCVFTWNKDGKNYWFFARYHKNSRKVLFVTYNNYPKNLLPYEDVKLAYDDESYLGKGFAEMVHMFQKELSNNVNWRTNNRNYAMLGVWRVSPESKLSSILDFFPGVAVPAREKEIELIKPGTDVGYNNAPDEFIMACAKERTGIDPAIGGQGGGVVNPKRGIYSAAGTSMVLAQQNNRNSLRTSDMRSAHVRIGQKLGTLYANFGIGNRIRRYASNSEILKNALESVRTGILTLKLRPTSASLNKELERQNDILLTDRLERYYQQQAQIIEAMMNPQAPPPLKEYFAQCIIAGRVMMQALIRNFNKSNVDAYLPQVKQLIGQVMAQQQQQPQGGVPNAPGAGIQAGGLNSIPRLPNGAMAGPQLPAGPGIPQQPV